MDIKEKTRLVTELYCKKLMYKCFVGWSDVALSVSDDEDIAMVSSSSFQALMPGE
jgi:hypothetical protein